MHLGSFAVDPVSETLQSGHSNVGASRIRHICVILIRNVEGNHLVEGLARRGLKLLEVPNDMNQVTVFHVNALVVLRFLVQLDILELLLEFKSVTHLVEEESNHDVTPALVRLESLSFGCFNTGVELVTVR